jgi:hypothetical protein
VRRSAHRPLFWENEWHHGSALLWEVADGDGRIQADCHILGRNWNISAKKGDEGVVTFREMVLSHL